MNAKVSKLCARYAAALADQGFPVSVDAVKKVWVDTPDDKRHAMRENMRSVVVDGRKISPETKRRLELHAFNKKKAEARKSREKVQRAVIVEKMRMAREAKTVEAN